MLQLLQAKYKMLFTNCCYDLNRFRNQIWESQRQNFGRNVTILQSTTAVLDDLFSRAPKGNIVLNLTRQKSSYCISHSILHYVLLNKINSALYRIVMLGKCSLGFLTCPIGSKLLNYRH